MPLAPWSPTDAPRLWLSLLTCLLALGGGACANRGMEAPAQIDGDGGFFETGGTPGTGGLTGPGTGGTVGTGGIVGPGGRGGSGGATGGVGGKGGSAGAGGTSATGGTPGTGGVAATGGVTGTGGVPATGGISGTGGVPATGGVTGTGGVPATGGITGTGGVPATGGVAGTGGKGGAGGGMAGAGGSAGGGGGAGASGNVCPLGGVLDCSSPGALTLSPDGQVADFSPAVWNSATGKWCADDGLRGGLLAFSGGSSSTSAAVVDATSQNFKLNLKVGAGSFAGAALTFDSCVNASSFTSVQFSATITAGSLTGCVWQVQLRTQDQTPVSNTNPSGGTCSTNCSRYPAVITLATPAASPTTTTYTELFTLFNNPSGSAISTPKQVTGVQWQVNSSAAGTGTCTVELRIDNVKFQ